jgi:glycogen debranching enzyme
MTKHAEFLRERPGFWSGALFGMLTGISSLLLFQYFSGILREPRLSRKVIVSRETQFETKEALAMFIAAESLRAGVRTRYLTHNVSKHVMHAGYRNFRESWARDFGFATYGMIALKQFDVVRETLEAFFWFQTLKGQFPVKLHSLDVVTRFLHSLLGREQPMQRILAPKYVSAHGAPSLDSEALLVISALYYVEQTYDVDFLKKNWDTLVLAMEWLKAFASQPSGLLCQQQFADWADSIDRHGTVLYTNVLYWKALSEMAKYALTVEQPDLATYYHDQVETISRGIQERLWRPQLGCFATNERLDNLSSDGNLLAIVWGLATADQAVSILKVMEEAHMAEPVPTRVVYPSYPVELIAVENILGDLESYHTNASWLWLGAWHLIALTQNGDQAGAQKIHERIVDVIVRDQQINEVHGPNSKPLGSFWYKSEAPLIWNAAMVLYAFDVYKQTFRVENNMLSILSSIKE